MVQEQFAHHRRVSFPLESAADRLAKEDGLTNEERKVRDERFIKPFRSDPKTAAGQLPDSRRAARGKKQKLGNYSQATEKVARAALKDGYAAYAGGIRSVYHESGTTYLDVIYEDLDAETQTFAALINDCAFQEDMEKQST